MKAFRSVMAVLLAVAMVMGLSVSLTLFTGSEPALAAWPISGTQGFGDPATNVGAYCMATYGSRLYTAVGLGIWSTDGVSWTQVMGQDPPGTYGTGPRFGNDNNWGVTSMAAFGGYLYAGTQNPFGFEIWRYDGTSWLEVVGQGSGSSITAPGFGNINNIGASSMISDGSFLYVGTNNSVDGCEIFAFNGTSWNWINPAYSGFGTSSNMTASSMAVYDGYLYVGTFNPFGCEVWRHEGTNWVPLLGGGAGFGNTNNTIASAMFVYGADLFVGTYNAVDGLEIWYYDGSYWTVRAQHGSLGGIANNFVRSMLVYDSRLFVGVDNAGGCELYAFNGVGYGWTEVMGAGLSGSDGPGFGNPNNTQINCMAVLNSRLYAGTLNYADGCEIHFDRFSTTWYLAEGATAGGFDTYILVQNPNGDPVDVDIKYQTREGEKQGPRDTIPAASRRTYAIDSDPNVQTYDVSTKVTASDNVICERAMYWKPEGASGYVLGHDSIGVTNPSPTWYLAEGATTGGYDTYILVQNPNDFDVTVNIGYYTDNGYEMGPLDTIPGASRRSYLVNADVQTYDVSTAVWATGDVVCERAVYWKPPGAADYVLGTDSIGVTDASRTWYLAEGATLGGYETWILVQNPNDRPVYVDIRYQTGGGEEQGPQEMILPNRRKSFRVNDTVQTYDVSTMVTADGDVICERAMYWKPDGAANFVLGHDSVGVTAACNDWYLAEGCTDGGYDTYILVQNPGSDPVEVQLSYMFIDGASLGPRDIIPPKSRKSFLVNNDAITYNVSTNVWVIGPGNVICERAVYWKPTGATSYVLGTNSMGWPAP